MHSFQLGWIEGFYGKPWSWAERAEMVGHLSRSGYRYYIYAPKDDGYLRRFWREPFSRERTEHLESLIDVCHRHGVEFGIGLSPLGINRSFDAESLTHLKKKIEAFNLLGVDRVSVLFDDMRGDFPDLAQTQATILHRIGDLSRAKRLSMCPTYYSNDPILDKIFGNRPQTYLVDLGRALDPSIGVYWTGERICSKSQDLRDLEQVRERLGRKPLLWDNYPVNDTPAMCKFLHLRGFSDRPAGLSEILGEHGINPMNQPELSRIPAETLVMNYAQKEGYRATQAFSDAAREILGPELAAKVTADLPVFQDAGLDGISPNQKDALLSDYRRFDHPAAREIANWLQGQYVVTAEQIEATHGRF